MTTLVRPIYEHEPDRGAKIHDSLSAAHRAITARDVNVGVLALNHSARVGDWVVTLGTSARGELDTASMVRMGQETYPFKRNGDKTWEATGTNDYLFTETHFYNLDSLVRMAIHDGVEWTSSPRVDEAQP